MRSSTSGGDGPAPRCAEEGGEEVLDVVGRHDGGERLPPLGEDRTWYRVCASRSLRRPRGDLGVQAVPPPAPPGRPRPAVSRRCRRSPRGPRGRRPGLGTPAPTTPKPGPRRGRRSWPAAGPEPVSSGRSVAARIVCRQRRSRPGRGPARRGSPPSGASGVSSRAMPRVRRRSRAVDVAVGGRMATWRARPRPRAAPVRPRRCGTPARRPRRPRRRRGPWRHGRPRTAGWWAAPA